ncbi:hypothetical protein [Nocardia sp. NPDC057227]|uniref:hypothetical protein n=1 Tax=Nocardia sp. NPDC057227 TaxID=3346056 RepID=UPI003640CCC1
MAVTPAPICSIRTCTTPATDLYSFRWQNRTVEKSYCHHHYLRNLANDRAIATWDDRD